ncbi:MAG: Ig-like domain-containing protein [Calditrichaceae bacterium]|nr:Ig-like domain-containing protein [Calditrichaceae bacterium]
MKKLWILFLIFPVVFLSTNSCEDSGGDDDDDSGADSTAFVSGYVFDSETLEPIQSAFVLIMEKPEFNTATDVYGFFQIELELETTERIHLIAAPTSYIPDTSLGFYVTPGTTTDSLILRPVPTGETLMPSGDAASIILSSVEPQSIGVRESGSIEVAALSFVVQDSTGRPVDANHSVNVYFDFGASPGGGLFFTPPSAQTNAVGEVTTYLFSGDSAGVVQVIARVNQPGLPIQSRPVAIAVHGGFPHQDHLGLGFEQINIPGLVRYGETTKVTAFVGDQYGNPVRPGTAVYFTTSYGIIEGSALTDEMGTATATIMSAEPMPWTTNGFSTVTARTVDQNDEMIEVSGEILFSGTPIITVNPTSFNLPNGGSQEFNFRICDLYGNPMSSGQQITVSASGNIKATGSIGFSMDDTQSQASTYYSFAIIDSKIDEIEPASAIVTISTTGPNNKAVFIITGSSL